MSKREGLFQKKSSPSFNMVSESTSPKMRNISLWPLLINDVYIIRIGSLSEFFSGSLIDVMAVLQLKNFNTIYTEIIGVHMSR
jgi:hypothetical protein